jgi:hypothetical protein
MSRFSLAPGEALDAAFRRTMRKQLRSAARAFEDEATPASAVHRARRCLKRSRALLALLEPAYGKKPWAVEIKALKSAGQRLAGARDEQAKLDALARVAAHAGAFSDEVASRFAEGNATNQGSRAAAPNTTVARLRRSLERRRVQHESEIDRQAGQELAATLDRVSQRFRRKRLGRFDEPALVDGIVATYRRGRKAMRRAFASGRNEDFHAWRREVQAHWRHMQLIEASWPAEVLTRAEAAKALSGLLGDEHDLWLLGSELADPSSSLRSPERDGLTGLCQTMQEGLRSDAKLVGRRLYAEKPRHLGKRLARYWRDAAAAGPRSAAETPADLADADVAQGERPAVSLA